VRSGAAKCERSTRGSPGKVDGRIGCAGGVDERKRESQGKHSWPQSRSSDVGIGSGGPLERWSQYCILGLEGETLAEGQLRTTQEDVGEFFPALTATRGSHRSGSSPGLSAGRDHRVGTRGTCGQPAVDGRVEASQAEGRSHRCRQVGTLGAGGTAVVVSDSASQSRSAPGSGGVASPGRLGIDADGV
jgi:hypothetical protein